ncbi:MAG TPA: hypothetical protein PL093_00965 [Candidatus Pacearchaeota archaeon]|jgi:hypothetical protein|nr:hypothetical protein [Candidatus Pacearchaeota archaeon]HQH20131.1 hypothetical protein [Candidatus Pacearchaeota archaeon]
MNQETLQIISILSGPVGVIVGILLTEWLNNSRQRFIYLEKMFEKKLEIYENLYKKMKKAYDLGIEILNDKESTKDERLKKWTATVLDVSKYLDDNTLYLNEYVRLHCALSVVGVEKVASLSGKEYDKAKDKYIKNWGKTEEIIKNEAGIERLEKFLSKINKSRNDSNYKKIIKKLKEDYIR